MDRKDIKKLQIYNFINVTHILHKLFKTLTTSELTLSLLTLVVEIIIWLVFVLFFRVGKKKRIVEMSNHCSRFLKLHFHLPFQQFSYRCRSSKFDPFFTRIHHWTLTILKYSISLSLTTSPSPFPIQRGTRSWSCDHKSIKSPTLKSINGVYVIKGLMFLAHNKEVKLNLLH